MTKSIYEQLPLSSIPTSSEVVWSDTGKVGFTHSGGTITRTGSAGWGLSKMQSDKTFTVGEGIIQIDFSTLGAFASGSLMLGLNSGTLGYYYSGTPYNPADFSIYMAGGDQVEVYENQVKKYGSGGGRNNLDKFRITIDNSGIVRYFCQPLGQGLYDLHYTSTVIASGTYFIQTNAYAGNSPSGICSSSEQTLPPLKQRFVETFSGDGLDTDRWDIYNSGTVPQGMADSKDGGYYITTTNSWDQVRLNFNDKRQFSPVSSKFIAMMKYTNSAAASAGGAGLIYDKTSAELTSNNGIGWSLSANNHYFATGDGTNRQVTTTGVTIDNAYHTYTGELNGSSGIGTIDGTTTFTNSTYIPQSSSKLQPSVWHKSGAETFNINYYEAYNT